MEAEERAAQSAKLQELIRRGGPQDLQEANRLMKVMAGYDTRHKTDYRAKAAEEVSKVQQKAKILEEMLQNHKEGENIGDGDVFEVRVLSYDEKKIIDTMQELASALQSAHPKIQRMCEEESDDTEAVGKLLEINDSIHRTVERYKLMKAGNLEAASKIPQGTLGTTTGVSKNAANELSLIDFDPEPSAPAAQTAQSSTSAANGSLLEAPTTSAEQTSVEDDLLGLSINDSVPSQPGSIILGSESGFGGDLGISSTSFREQRPASNLPTTLASPPPQQSPKPNYDAFASLTSPFNASKPATPGPALNQQRQTSQAHTQAHTDPFASLISSGSRPGTPSQHRNGSQAAPKGTSLLELAHSHATAPAQANSATATKAAADDDWTFESSLPEQPTTHTMLVHTSRVKIEFASRRQTGQPLIQIVANFSSQLPQQITGLHFQVAVEKGYTLQLRPQTGRDMAPNQLNAIQQEILLSGVPMGKGSSIKMRFKVSYQVNGQTQEEQGNVPSLGIS